MRILVVDLSSVFWTIAEKEESSARSAREYALKDIRHCARDHDRVVVAVDGDDRLPNWPQAPWRRSIWPSYKTGREERPEWKWALLRDTIAHCVAEGWVVFRPTECFEVSPESDGAPGRSLGFYEADDVVGSVVVWCRKNGHSATIRTGDSDLGQLVRNDAPTITLVRRIKGEYPQLDEVAIAEWCGVPPRAVASLKALAGDDGDGYGGASSPYPGIGKKTAIEMLKAANGDAALAVEMAIASDRKNKDGKSVPAEIKICRERGLDPVKAGLRLARLCFDMPLDYGLISAAPVATPPPSLPEQAPNVMSAQDRAEIETVDAEIVSAREAAQSSGALTIHEPPRMLLCSAELNQRDREIDALIKGALKYGPPDGISDYGLIPFCGNKPALFDVGAERLSKVFGFYPRYKIIDKALVFCGEDARVFYMVRCRLHRVGSDHQIGESIASCNGGERTFRKKDGTFPPIEDLINPVYTRAAKRAFVRAVLRATGAQKYLSSGFEDLSESDYGYASDQKQWEQK